MPLTRWLFLLLTLTLIFSPHPLLYADALADCRQLWLSGQYEKCIDLAAAQQLADVISSDRFAELKARAEAALGKYAEACMTLQSAIRSSPINLQNRWLLIELAPYADLDVVKVNQQREFELVVNSGAGRFTRDCENMVTLARFALDQGADPRQVQEIMLKRAKTFDPQNIQPHLLLGELALDKRDFALAAETFHEARTLAPQHPEVLFGLARSLTESDPRESKSLLAQTLAINPRHAGALLVRAEALVNAEQYTDARICLDEIIAFNAHHPEALALQSVIQFLSGREEQADALRIAALSTWKSNPRVDFLIGKTLSQKYRFDAGAAAQQRALNFHTNYLPAKKQLALDLLRLGREQEGWRIADSVYQQDQYDVTSYNLVTLRDELENFTTLERDGLLVRMEQHEAELYGERVLELLIDARRVLCEKYEIPISKTILIEIFPKPADFAVRTFGMPGAGGYLGVCFGDVVTARSPASQTIQPNNWKAVLWHEFAHVVTLNKTHHRMPRWLSEGISVYEERQRDPLWGEQMTPTYRKMIEDGELIPISRLSGAFLAPKSSTHLMFAYYESSMVVQYLNERYGHAVLLAILNDLAIGMEINESIERQTVPMPQLEEEFEQYLQRQVRLFGWYVDWDPVDFSQTLQRADAAEQLIKWTKRHPRNYIGLKTCGELLARLERPRDAIAAFTAATALFPRETGPRSAWAQLAELQHQLGDTAGECESLKRLVEIDDDAATALLRLIEINIDQQEWAQIQDHAQRLIAIKPLIPQPYTALAKAAEHRADHTAAIGALQALLKLPPVDRADVHYRLAVQLQQQGDMHQARRHVLQALEEAPRYRAALRLLLELQSVESN